MRYLYNFSQLPLVLRHPVKNVAIDMITLEWR